MSFDYTPAAVLAIQYTGYARPRKPMHRVRCGVWVPAHEAAIEKCWLHQRGVHPATGNGWLTPRMQRDAHKLKELRDYVPNTCRLS